MSQGRSTPDRNRDASSSSFQPAKPQALRPQRILACVLCQQRKLKCDRKFPCAHCIKSRAQCVPATLAPRQRRRILPERELLERIRKYEDLLKQNNIKFEPLHRKTAGAKEQAFLKGGYDSDDEQREVVGADGASPSTVESEKAYKAKNIFHAMSQGFRDPDNESDSSQDDLREVVVNKVWDQFSDYDDSLLFGSHLTTVDLSTLHPEPAQILRLWQIYLDNVNPIFKVTHTPDLQRRIIEVAGNMGNIDSVLEALMFSIYCMAILSLPEGDHQTMFGSSKADLSMKFQFGCQQALLNCGFLRSDDRDCLTALFLYLVSIQSKSSPKSLSSMLAIAVRIAERMGIHSETICVKQSLFEAEMRRRLWWSLVLFDARVSELAVDKTTTLIPTWDCNVPLNVNDSDLRPEMKDLPTVQEKSTDASFAVMRSEVADYIRHSMFHLDFANPALKSIARHHHHSPTSQGSELVRLESTIEDKYVKFCNAENSLDLMTIWTARVHLARYRLMEYYSRSFSSSIYQTDVHRDDATSNALRMLEFDTKILVSPFTKGFIWLNQLYFPFPAYHQIVQDMSRRPTGDQAERAWEIMSDHYDARFMVSNSPSNPILEYFSKTVLQAWKICEAASMQESGKPMMQPRIVSVMKHHAVLVTPTTQFHSTGPVDDVADTAGIDDNSMRRPMDIGGDGLPYSMGWQDGYARTSSGEYDHTLWPTTSSGLDASQLDWAAMDWDLIKAPSPEAANNTQL